MIPEEHILITGGAGFIGSHLADHLLSLGYAVTVLDNLSNGSLTNLAGALRQPRFRFIQGDILNRAHVAEAAAGAAVIYHLACLGVRHSIHSPFENHRVNAEGTLNILEAAKQNQCGHVFYISTSEVYGGTSEFPITEKSPTNPLTVYGASKLAGEQYTNAYRACYGLHTTVLRIFNNYGPRAHYEGDAGELIPRSIVRILGNEAPVVFGDGSNTRDFIFVKDTVRALAGLLNFRKDITGETFVIGSGTEYAIKDILIRLLELMDKSALGMQHLPERPADVPRLWVDARKFNALTAFTPAYTLHDGLKETIGYYSGLSGSENLAAGLKLNNWEK